jgi:hypothetical protein
VILALAMPKINPSSVPSRKKDGEIHGTRTIGPGQSIADLHLHGFAIRFARDIKRRLPASGEQNPEIKEYRKTGPSARTLPGEWPERMQN